MQLTYTSENDLGLPGQKADSGDHDIVSRVNPDVALPFGTAACKGTDPDRDLKLPTTKAEAESCEGLVVATQSIESSASGDPQYPVKSSVPYGKLGRFLVKVTEAVTPTDNVYIRFGDGVDDDTIVQKGSFGASPDGTAKVLTLTPTVVNAGLYSLALSVPDRDYHKHYSYVADGSAEDTEIVAALLDLVNVDTATHGITASGSDTLILTGGVAGEDFSAEGSYQTVVETEAAAPSAARNRKFKYVTSAAADGIATVQVVA